MTQQEKDLLLRDLCARLPYGVTCTTLDDRCLKGDLLTIAKTLFGYRCKILCGDVYEVPISNIIPYLRPMYRMTPGEALQLADAYEKMTERVGFGTDVDFLNAHHLDYRGLIEKGLALEAPERIYVTD